ncbi:FixH family protein [Fodinibius salsisoli]|uniref:FixH family protein n=1 Tax=Fodinibius salsisoli TaxID=2820877 RepID=A0ABT3PPQ2_9BACT|nr:FixH family protein [Fodinibius salsisoli]MCW9707845.1 FixH family protein [Fodinibius salsisoli]
MIVCLAAVGCAPSDDADPDINLQWEITPNPPSAGMAQLDFTLRDSTEQLIKGAEVKLEGNMSHPGMQPVLTTAEEIAPGKYSANIKFTMGGDWFILVKSTLADGREVRKQIEIAGVRSEK